MASAFRQIGLITLTMQVTSRHSCSPMVGLLLRRPSPAALFAGASAWASPFIGLLLFGKRRQLPGTVAGPPPWSAPARPYSHPEASRVARMASRRPPRPRAPVAISGRRQCRFGDRPDSRRADRARKVSSSIAWFSTGRVVGDGLCW